MSKKVFVYLPEKEMEALGIDPAPYKEKLHQVAESLFGELLTDVIESYHEVKSKIDAYMELLKRCDEADVIITIDTYSPFTEGPRMQLWRISEDMFCDICECSDKRLFVIDSRNLFTPKEYNELYDKRYKDQATGRATCTCTPIPCGEGKIEEV